MSGSVPIENKHLHLKYVAAPWTLNDLRVTPREVLAEDEQLSPQQLECKRKDISMNEGYDEREDEDVTAILSPEYAAKLELLPPLERFKAKHALSQFRKRLGEDVKVLTTAEYVREFHRIEDEEAKKRGEPTKSAQRKADERARKKDDPKPHHPQKGRIFDKEAAE